MRPPIADPFGPPASFAEESRSFRKSFWRVYIGALLSSVFIIVPLMGIFFWFFMPQMFVGNGRIALTTALSFQLLISPLSSALGGLWHPLKVTRFGVQGPSGIGFVEWERMKSVRTFWFGSPWARIALQSHFLALWVPLALTDFNGFARTLEEWAPEGNPLRVWAQERGL